MSSIREVEHLQIPLPRILSATNNFDEKKLIGMGGFGKVYQGQSEQYGTIAVKRLDRSISGQGQHEFMMEIALLSAYKHENLASLVGFCDQDGEKVLVYKHESNGSLDKILQSKDLNWIQRLRICLDAAKGLKYLHHDVGAQHRVLHRDLKSSNILLDENWKAKISDFGLSKIGPANVKYTFLISTACGTIGYIDPEYISSGVLTQKSDVYSFGVVLFEVLCGRQARVRGYGDEREFLFKLVRNHYPMGTMNVIIDLDLLRQMKPTSLITFSTIAYQCLENRREDRPTMSQIVKQLQKALDYQVTASSGLRQNAALQQGLSTSKDNMITQSTLMPSSSSLSTHASYQPLKLYDVFLSFKRANKFNAFVDHLYHALARQGIQTYKDDETLSRGEIISPLLLKAIEKSHIAIIVFSKNYVDSSCGLQKLVHIMKCKEERGQIVMPIFYHVDPLEIRIQHGEFEKGINRQKSNVNKIEPWRKALADATNLPGWSAINIHESDLIQKIVNTISQRLISSTSSGDTDLIGMKTRMQVLKSHLQVGFGGVRMVGILGTWGSGKSTLASAIYDEICHEFKGCCFVQNVDGESRMQGMKTLQEKILSNVLNPRELVVLGSIREGISMMESRLRETSALIVLDEVDHLGHLRMLAGSKDWFGEGSRIIITTRNKKMLNAHSINIIYEVKLLSQKEAVELFSRHAFGAPRPVEGYEKLSVDMVCKFGGNPSAVKRLSSILRGKDMSKWMRTSARLEDTTVDEILELFRTGDDGVESYIDSWLGF